MDQKVLELCMSPESHEFDLIQSSAVAVCRFLTYLALYRSLGQERGLRSGTLPHNLAVGLGEACRIAQHEMEADAEHCR